jgi:hypothetical protein
MDYSAMSTALASLAAIAVIIRLVHKRFFASGVRTLWFDDWFIILTMVTYVPSAYFNVSMVEAGLGRDIWTLTSDQITDFLKIFWIGAVLYFAEVFLLKLSILFFYMRIFPFVGIGRLLWATVVVNTIWGLTFVFLAIFQCTPIDYVWTIGTGTEGHCLDIGVVSWVHAAISIALDL